MPLFSHRSPAITSFCPRKKQLLAGGIFAAALFTLICLISLSAFLITEYSQARFAARIADQVLRFHIIANSDSDPDQAVKLQVRDALISYMAKHSEHFSCADDAAAFARDHCEELQQVAQAVIRGAGLTYPVQAHVTTCTFPKKTYGDLSFPAGSYQALCIELGTAQGENWWCILYPLLCFTEEGTVTVPADSQTKLIDTLSERDYRRLRGTDNTDISIIDPVVSDAKKKVSVRFWLWDLLFGT